MKVKKELSGVAPLSNRSFDLGKGSAHFLGGSKGGGGDGGNNSVRVKEVFRVT